MKTFDLGKVSNPMPVPIRGSIRRTHLRQRARTAYMSLGKRLFDLCFGIALLPLLAPLIATLWLIVRLDGGPGFFGHRRVGRKGKSFRCWKIRTMVEDSEAALLRHFEANPEAAAEWARDQKLADDPRITKLGNFLRATSLDELPQIWNVLKGDMSFVGPRPVVRDELRRYGEHRTAYLSIKPGLTGLWQTSGRNDVSYDERVQMDVDYLDKASLKTDLMLLARTFNAVAGQTGR